VIRENLNTDSLKPDNIYIIKLYSYTNIYIHTDTHIYISKHFVIVVLSVGEFFVLK